MTELAPLNTHADLQLASASASAAYAPASHPTTNGFSAPTQHHVEDEDNSVIRCFCGLSEDDGNTVLCEICNTWQHILCYYPRGNDTVPDEHVCVICNPRKHSPVAALERQQSARGLASPQERKIKKPPSKSHKKKVKDVNTTSIQTNGWISGNDAPDRASGSPHDQGPPAKRPKTTHRSSASTSTAFAPGHSRKRAGSTTLNGQSPTKSPRSHSPEAYTGDYYTPEFMRSSTAQFTHVEDNTYGSIHVSNDLQTWLTDQDALRDTIPGISQKDVFTRWDRPIEALKQMSPGINPCRREDSTMLINGTRPVHRWVEANTACSKDSYIGELNGVIGRIEDYQADPHNRWEHLRHPEPYVFFHERLPIYVDCRQEGNALRHVGRSCFPNVKLQIIIHGSDFHFCFISLREISAGEELTVPWHLRDKELELVRQVGQGESLTPEDEAYLSQHFTNMMANFGGCACSRLGPGVVCNLAKYDLRNKERPYVNTTAKATKARKPKRPLTQISPGSTGRATNSRAGSEAVLLQGDNDEEMADSRSLSAKSRSQPSSRDITPMIDAAMGLGVGMSDRERRKLLQQEKLFEKMEADGGGRKAKRPNAGSAANTPGPSSSVGPPSPLRCGRAKANQAKKQLGFPENTSPTATLSKDQRPRTNGSTPRPVNGAGAKSMHRSKPEMVSMPTQTGDDLPTSSTPTPPRRRITGSSTYLLVRRVREEAKRRRERSASVLSLNGAASPTLAKNPASPGLAVAAKLEGSPEMAPPPVPSVPVVGEAKTEDIPEISQEDVEMNDAPALDEPHAKKQDAAASASQPPPSDAPSSDAPAEPPAPPWPSDKQTSAVDSPTFARPTHVTLPPVPTFPTTASTSDTPTTTMEPSDQASAPADTPDTSIIASPFPLGGTTAPLLSPSLSMSSITAPSPAKKKMSLGDWMAKRKEKDAAVAKQALQVKSDVPELAEEEGEVAVEDVDMPLAPPAASSREGDAADASSSKGVDVNVKEEAKEEGEVAEDEVEPTTASTAASSS
jgi:hypothetical protein